MKKSTRSLLYVIILVLIPMFVSLQAKIDPLRAQFQPGKKGVNAMMAKVGNNPVVLPSQFMAGTLIGFKEVVAGMLWVRCDDFFHDGNFDAIIPLIRIITWLDPHNLDVYCTGAWHMAYNFTDSRERADPRYLPCSIALLEEAAANNPDVNDPLYDLGFEIYQQKLEDFDKSAYWISKACETRDDPTFHSRMLAHAYQMGGKYDEAEKQWRKCIAFAAARPKGFGMYLHQAVSQRNLDGLLMRRIGQADYAKHRYDAAYDVRFRRIGPKVFEITGKAKLPDYSRIDVRLVDADYKMPVLQGFSSTIDEKVTAMIELGTHGIQVRNGEFHRKYDLTKDAAQYPFAKDKYKLMVSFDPRSNDEMITDMVGMGGERLDDKQYLDTSVKGLRKLTKTFNLTKKDIL